MQKVCEMVVPLMRTMAAEQKCSYHPMSVEVLNILQNEGYIRGFRVEGSKMRILLKHYQGAPVIRNIRVVSKPSRDIWVTPTELINRTQFNTGTWVMQTPNGIMSHRDCIRLGIGGKMIFAVNNGYQQFC